MILARYANVRCLHALALAALIFHSPFSLGQSGNFDDEFDDLLKPWKEIEARLPPRPEADALITVHVSAATAYQFRIDRNSIAIGSDGVVRYTLVGTSDQGAVNISYEGIRCATREKKLYAFGRPDGSWSRSRRNAWEPIHDTDRNRQHAALFIIVCDGRSTAKNVEDILTRNRNPPVTPP